MKVDSIEVIRDNPGVAADVVVGERAELTYGDKLRVNVSLEYRGWGQTVTLYGAIGVRGVGFNERVKGEADFPLPDSHYEFSPASGSVDIPITSDISPGTDYDLYLKLLEYPGAGMPEVDDVIDIVGIPPTYDLIQHTIYPYAYVHDGDVEVTTATFKTDPFTPSAWAAQRFADALESEVAKEGGRVLELEVYVDTTPLLWTNFRVDVKSTPLGGAIGVGVGMPGWVAILIIALAIVAVIVAITLSVRTIVSLFTRKPLSEEIKLTWSRGTLISIIGDFEVKLERTPTPPGELEEMSDQELRDHCDQMAEAIVPPEVAWVPLVVVGGLGVLGVGAVAALALAARPRG